MANPYTATFPNNSSFTLSANPGLGYQIKLVDESGNSLVTWQNSAENPMQTDFDDIRFCDELDNQLSYWIESKTDSSEAFVWVKLASSSATKIILNWGNASATSESSLANTMEWGDEFSAALDMSTKWDGTYGSVSDGLLHMISDKLLFSRSTFLPGHEIIARYKTTLSEQFSGHYFGFGYDGYDNDAINIVYSNVETNPFIKSKATGTSSTTAASTAKDTSYHNFRLYYGVSSAVMKIDSESVTHSANIPTGALTVKIFTTYPTATADFEFIAVRKYNGSDPTITLDTPASAPVASFTATPVYRVVFADTSDPAATSWDWDFGDGSTHGDTANQTHTYAEAGTYTVTLIATNEGGSDTYSTTVTVGGSGTNTLTVVRIHEMDHMAGTTQKHIVRVITSDGSGYLSEYTTATLTAYVDGTPDAGNPQSWTISAYDDTIRGYWVTIPDTFSVVFGQNVNIIMSCYDAESTLIGEGELHLNVVSEAADGGATAQQVWEYTTRTITAVPTGGATSAQITALNNLSSADIISAVGTALTASDALRILDIIMSGTFTITAGEAGAFTCTYTSRTDLSTIEFSVDGNGQRTAATVTLV